MKLGQLVVQLEAWQGRTQGQKESWVDVAHGFFGQQHPRARAKQVVKEEARATSALAVLSALRKNLMRELKGELEDADGVDRLPGKWELERMVDNWIFDHDVDHMIEKMFKKRR